MEGEVAFQALGLLAGGGFEAGGGEAGAEGLGEISVVAGVHGADATVRA
jgi:hypothetical protein